MAHPELLADKDRFSLAYYDEICLFVPRAPPDAEMTGAMQHAVNVLRKRAGHPIGFLLVVPADAPSPAGGDTATARRDFGALKEDVGFFLAVLEGSGFVAAAKRSLVTTLLGAMLGRKTVKTFSDVEAAARWAETEAKVQNLVCPPRHELQRYVVELRARTAR